MANYGVKGENNPKAKLTVTKVRRIRIIYEAYRNIGDPLPGKSRNCLTSVKKLARRFKVSESTMGSLLRRQTWRFV